MKRRRPDYCPECGAEVPARASACPECGSCSETGWSDHAHASRLGIPDEDFDYAEFVRREFGEARPPANRRGRFWWWVALGVLLLFSLPLLLGWLGR